MLERQSAFCVFLSLVFAIFSLHATQHLPMCVCLGWLLFLVVYHHCTTMRRNVNLTANNEWWWCWTTVAMSETKIKQKIKKINLLAFFVWVEKFIQSWSWIKCPKQTLNLCYRRLDIICKTIKVIFRRCLRTKEVGFWTFDVRHPLDRQKSASLNSVTPITP